MNERTSAPDQQYGADDLGDPYALYNVLPRHSRPPGTPAVPVLVLACEYCDSREAAGSVGAAIQLTSVHSAFFHRELQIDNGKITSVVRIP